MRAPGKTAGKLKLVCPNPECLNKATVYRKYDILKEQKCCACDTDLVPAKDKKAQKFDAKAKIELKQLYGKSY